MHLCFYWFENLEKPTSYSMDNLRDYFTISKDNAHDALQDCRDTSAILIKFLKLHRRIAAKTKFEGSFKEIENDEG